MTGRESIVANCSYIVTRYPIRDHIFFGTCNISYYYYQQHLNISSETMTLLLFKFRFFYYCSNKASHLFGIP